MANFVDNSTINLSINGRQANMVLDTMRQKAKDLEKALEKAQQAGDKKKIKQLHLQLREVKRIIQQSTSNTASLEEVMRRLDRASPKELKNTLNILQRQMATMQRGTKEWEEQARKIRRVKEEMQRLNQAMQVQKSTWERFKSWLNDSQTALMGIIGVLTGFVAAGKDAVQKYADIEQEMANVRKFTGMTADEVDRLNQEFLKLDTRSSREDLNKLAQEAGRLGKTSIKDVLGFVRAADKINVALDDLGDGATLTLSKLTGIFGDEERYGTEQSLLKVGSVINELSQNCSASAPYIANFTERLGGVGAQAGMTIQQIMGFAAVLDSNSQKVEASATALSQVIVRLYQDPAKYARVAGLDVQKFSDLMRKDANSALILFLETLQKAGGMDVLSPMFKDMGENGARAIAALSTLATNIQAVKDQQKVANEAFDEGTSVLNEFEVQNTTVQAGMDKARKSLNEIAVQLGQKLMPIVTHIYSSSSVMLKFMAAAVDFIAEHSRLIITLTAALTGYKVALVATANWTKALTALEKAKIAVTRTLSMTMILFSGNIERAHQAWRLMSRSMMANPFALWTAAASALIVMLVNLTRKTKEFGHEAKKIIRTSQEVSQEAVKEQRELDALFGKLDAAKKGTEQYLKAKKDIIDNYGKYLSGLIDEKGEIIDLAKAYDTLREAVRRSAQERSLAAAKENLQNTFAEQSSKDITELQKSLESFGASQREAVELAQIVSEAIVSGESVPQATVKRISELSEGGPKYDSEGNRYKNALQRIAGKKGSVFESIGVVRNAVESPERILGRLSRSVVDFEKSVSVIEGMQNAANGSRVYSDETLRKAVVDLDKVISEGSGTVAVPDLFLGYRDTEGKSTETTFYWDKAAKEIRDSIAHELNLRGIEIYASEESDKKENPQNQNPGDDGKKGDPLAKALKELELLKQERIEKATVEYAAGLTDYLRYINDKHDAETSFYDESQALYQKWSRTQDEGYRQLLLRRSAYERSWKEQNTALTAQEIKVWQKQQEIELRLEYSEKGALSEQEEKTLQNRLFLIKIQAMQKELSLLNEGSEEYARKKEEIETALSENLIRIRTELAKKTKEIEQKYMSQSPEQKIKAELDALKAITGIEGGITQEQYDSFSKQIIDKYKADLPGAKKKSNARQAKEEFEKQKKILDQSLAEGLISQEEYADRLKEIHRILNRALISGLEDSGSEWVQQLTSMYQAWVDFADSLNNPKSDPFEALSNGIRATAAIMQSVMQSVTQFTQAETEIQTAAIERRYAREAAFAEGNAYLQSRLEKKKEKEIAKLKSDAAKKNFAMQVASTLATTAANAVSAYGAALQVGVAGLILAPVAAALALAQGAVQIAVLKKQQQAASAGYSEGGFTKKGRKDEPAGIVHAGEWVASQKLVNNPRVRPVIDILEYAQRTNTVASLSMEDVSRSISAPMELAVSRQQPSQPSVVTVQQPAESSQQLTEAINRLNDRLEKPFITHNTVEGPLGYKQAQDEYMRLMSNKSK